MSNTIRSLGILIFTFLFWSCQPSGDQEKTAQYASVNDADSILRVTSFKQWLDNPEPLISAHRGGPYPGFPENAIETFQNITDQIPVIIECDVAITKDSVLILMHDKTLDRTTTGEGNVIDVLYDDVRNLSLVDNEGDTTLFSVPTLDEVLEWGKGKALFTLDIKRGVPFERVIRTVEKFEAVAYAAIITYRIQDAELVHSLNADLMISVSAGDSGALEQINKSGIPVKNILGFVGTREPDSTHYSKLKELGIKTILGTLGNLDKSAIAKDNDQIYLNYIRNGADIIATDRPLEVAKVLNSTIN